MPSLRSIQLAKKKRNSKSSHVGRVRSRLELLEDRLLLTTAPFIGGDIVIARAGEGHQGLTNAGNVLVLDEYTPAGVLVSSTTMPFNTSQAALYAGGDPSPATTAKAPNAIVTSGSAAPTGYLNLSADGTAITFVGYNTQLPFNGSIAVKGTTATQVPREVGVIDINKVLDNTTSLQDFSSLNTPLAAISPDGIHVYPSSNQTGGVRFATVNDASPATTSVELNNPLATGGISKVGTEQIYNGQLYVNNGSGIYVFTKAATDPGLANYPNLPTTAGATVTQLPGINTALGDFFFETLNPSAHAGQNNVGLTQPDTVYIANSADTGTNGRIDKYTAVAFDPTTGVATSWKLSGYVQATATNGGGVTGLTGYSTGSSVVMFATDGNANSKSVGGGGTLFTFTDTSGYNVPLFNGSGGAFSGFTTYMTGYTPGATPTYASATVLAAVGTGSDMGFRGVSFAPNQAPAFTAAAPVTFATSVPENVAPASNSVSWSRS